MYTTRPIRRFWVALAVSLACHILLLVIRFPTPVVWRDSATNPTPRELQVRLGASPAAPSEAVASRPARRAPSTTAKRQPPRARIAPSPRPSPMPSPQEPAWTQAQRDEMRRFLDDLGEAARPPSGRELASRALAMARALGAEGEHDDEAAMILRRLHDADIDPFNIEQYYEALFRKLNQSAAMERNHSQEIGNKVAVVRVVLNADGSVRRFSVLQAGDRQADIAYIRSVVERAAPFPAFPARIRKATDEMILQICIQPSRFGAGGAPFFTRMLRGQGCTDAG